MPDTMTTVRTGFPVQDITHKPKRMQNDNLKAVLDEDKTVSLVGEESDVPNIVTLERAIKFYESHAKGEYANLYTQTAKWLREFMSRSLPVDVGTDIDKAQALLEQASGGNK